MAPLYYRGAMAAILVYDLTSYDSFEDMQSWLNGAFLFALVFLLFLFYTFLIIIV